MGTIRERVEAADQELLGLLKEFSRESPQDQLFWMRRWKKVRSGGELVDDVLERVSRGETELLSKEVLLRAVAQEVLRGGQRPQARLRALDKIGELAGILGGQDEVRALRVEIRGLKSEKASLEARLELEESRSRELEERLRDGESALGDVFGSGRGSAEA